MRKYKNALAWALTVIFLLNILMVVPVSANSVPIQPPTALRPTAKIVNNQMLSTLGTKPHIPKIAQDAIKRGVKPGALEGVAYTLSKNVELLSDEAIQSIKSNVKNGIVDVSRISSIDPESDKTYVDKISGSAFQFVRGTDNKTYLYTAENDSLVEEINIPDQSVRLNSANISFQNDNVEINPMRLQSTSDIGSSYEIKFNKDLKVTGIDEYSKNTVGVKIDGSLFINAPTLDAKYTKWDGYKFVYHASENAKVSAELYCDIKSEVKVPLLGFDIPSDICSVTVGVFLVIGVDGKITLDYSFEQHYDITAGVQGGTWYYIPTSLDGVLQKDFGFDTDGVDISGKIKGDIFISAEVALKILGKVSIDIGVKLGMALEATVDTGNADSLQAKAEGYLTINARIKISSRDWKKELFSYHFLLFDKTQKPKSNYIISINEACAYRDIIKGRVEILTAPESENPKLNVLKSKSTSKLSDNKRPYTGPLTLSVTGAPEAINVNTDNNGDFTVNYNLVNGSKVMVKIPETQNMWTDPVMASFPFDNIAIDDADYYKGVVTGYISPDDKKTLFYIGPVNICLINTENIPITASKVLTAPENQTIIQQVNCTNGSFRTAMRDLDPYDMLYAYIDYDGFRVYSKLTEPEGLEFNVSGDYIQQPGKLLTEERTIVLGGSYYINKAENNSKARSGNSGQVLLPNPLELPNALTGMGIVEPTGEIKYKVRVFYPHGQTSQNIIEKEWNLPLNKTKDGVITASTGSWEMDLPNIQADQLRPSSPLLSLRGDHSVQYHVQEIIEYFYKGKRIEIVNEALTCDYEKAEEGIRLPNILGLDTYDTPLDNKTNIDPLQNRIDPRINPVLGMSSFLFRLNTDANNSVVPYSANINDNGTTNTAQSQNSSNFSCNVQVKKYDSASDNNPETSNWNLMVNGSNLKITSGNTSIMLLRDQKIKVYLNNEFHTATPARYDGEDYIPELSKNEFTIQKPQKVNGQMCNVYEKRGLNTILRICELKDKGVPVSVVLTRDGSKIEMVFSNYLFNSVTTQDMSY